ncbi:MAG: VIT and VWA domain-containing protein [Saprospiraceae bacterium]
MKKLFGVLLICLSAAGNLVAQSQTNQSEAPYFFVQSESGTAKQTLPLVSTDAQVNIAGMIADVLLTQVYTNTGTTPIEAIYVFPASTNAAVYGLRMELGSRCIIAKIKERNQARQEYNQAKSEGKRASLLEQERPNVFQMNVANIMPGDTIKVSLQYTELLVPEGGDYQFLLPTVVGPRYTNGSSKSNDGFTKNPTFRSGEKSSFPFSLTLRLNAGMPIQDARCKTHKVQIQKEGADQLTLQLDPSEKYGNNRDFIFKYKLQGSDIQSGLLLYEGENENFFLSMIQPPRQLKSYDMPPREYVFVVDVSGSMNGFPINTSKKLLRELISKLRPEDEFNVVLFAGASNILASQSLPATATNVQNALAFIDKQQGSGSTEMLTALQRVFQLPRSNENTSRSIVLVTDGYIDFETQCFDLVRNELDQANLFVFGIGSGVNHFLLEGMAHAGQGLPFLVQNEQEAPEVANKFLRYISNPVYTQIHAKFKGFDAYDVEPISIADVMAERPIVLFGKYRGEASGEIQLEGYAGKSKRKKKVRLSVADYRPDANNKAIRYLWARERIRHLSDYHQVDYYSDQRSQREKTITALGLDYNLLTAFTSFVAIEEVVVNKTGELNSVRQAVPLPQGVSNMAIGFDLSLEGISRLAEEGSSGSPIAAIAFVLCAFLALFFMRKKSIRLFGLFLLAGLWGSSCAQKEISYSDADSITFILGDDASGRNPYFSKAQSYFSQENSDKTELMVSGCGSMEELVDYLQTYPPRSGAWKKINLVAHGNEWTGMNVPVCPDGPRSSSKNLAQALEDGLFPVFDASVLDTGTTVVLHACKLGIDTALLTGISEVFGNRNGEHARVQSAPYFTIFETNPTNPDQVDRYLADYRYVSLPAGSFPGNKAIARKLESRYPADTTDFRAALNRLKPRFRGDSYVHYFTIPVSWTILFAEEEDLPGPDCQYEATQLLKGQKELQQQLAEMNLPFDDFRWEFEQGEYLDSDRRRYPALFAKGNTIIYCILQPLSDSPDSECSGEDQYLTVRYTPENQSRNFNLFSFVSPGR